MILATKKPRLILGLAFTLIFASMLLAAVPAAAMTIGSSNSSASYKQGVGLNSGLVGWWTFDAKDFSDATHVTDKSGSNNTGTVTGGVTKTIGKIGQALRFDGTTSYVDATGYTYTSFTESAWIKIASTYDCSHFSGIVSYSDSSNLRHEIALNGTDCTPIITVGGNYNISTVSPLSKNVWHHIVGTYDGANKKLYVDGVLYGLGVNNGGVLGTVSLKTEIGTFAYTLNNLYDFPGSIDDVRIYNRALSVAEVKQLYAMGGGKIAATPGKQSYQATGLRSGLVGWWTFDSSDINATQVLDKSGNNNTGTRNGGASIAIGKLGQAMKNDASTGYIDVADNSSLDPTIAMSFSVWFKPFTKRTGLYDVVLLKPFVGSVGGNEQYEILRNDTAGVNNDKIIGEIKIGGANRYVYSNTTWTSILNKWTHVTVTYDGIFEKIYINGVMESSTPITGAINTDTGNLGLGGSFNFLFAKSGITLDDVRVYNRALSVLEIQQLYKQGGGKIAATPGKQSYQVTGLRSGLVGWWTFDSSDINATQVLDKSGQNNTGTRNGGAFIATGKLGQAMKFDGSTGYVRTSAINCGANCTFSFWMMPKKLHDYGDPLSFGTADWGVTFVTYADGHMFFGVGNGGSWGNPVTTAAGTFVNNKWYYVVGKTNNGIISLYINGILINNALNSNTVNDVINIGARTVASYYFNGIIDDVRIYNRALSLSEIQQLYAMGK